jgi:hypothetical protein
LTLLKKKEKWDIDLIFSNFHLWIENHQRAHYHTKLKRVAYVEGSINNQRPRLRGCAALSKGYEPSEGLWTKWGISCEGRSWTQQEPRTLKTARPRVLNNGQHRRRAIIDNGINI